MSTAFELVPFPSSLVPAGVRVTGEARRIGALLALRWWLEAPHGAVTIAPPERPERQDDLWQQTCFECFLAGEGLPGYWEFNLSPAGHWNVYRFTGYRAGMAEELAFATLPFSVVRESGRLEATLAIDLAPLGLAEVPWRLAIATVVAPAAGAPSYWALAHAGAEPDFHQPEAFALRLEPTAP